MRHYECGSCTEEDAQLTDFVTTADMFETREPSRTSKKRSKSIPLLARQILVWYGHAWRQRERGTTEKTTHAHGCQGRTIMRNGRRMFVILQVACTRNTLQGKPLSSVKGGQKSYVFAAALESTCFPLNISPHDLEVKMAIHWTWWRTCNNTMPLYWTGCMRSPWAQCPFIGRVEQDLSTHNAPSPGGLQECVPSLSGLHEIWGKK